MDAGRAETRQPRHEGVELDMVLAELQRQLHQCTDEMQVINECACHAGWKNSEALSKISHEITSPLSDVIRLGRLMQKSELDSSQEKCIETIVRSCQALMQSLYDATDFSRMDDVPAVKIVTQKSNRLDDLPPLIDMDYVNKMRSDFPDDVFASLVQQYCSDTERTLHDLEHALDSRDISAIKNLLHLLKGCSANFGAAAVVKLCGDHTERLKRLECMTKSEFACLKQVYEGTKNQLLQIVSPLT